MELDLYFWTSARTLLPNRIEVTKGELDSKERNESQPSSYRILVKKLLVCMFKPQPRTPLTETDRLEAPLCVSQFREESVPSHIESCKSTACFVEVRIRRELPTYI